MKENFEKYFELNEYKPLFEVTEDVYNEIISWLKSGDLSFDNIFGDNYRILAPFNNNSETKATLTIKNTLEELGYEVNLEKGLASKVIETARGEKVRVMRIGKILEDNKLNHLKKLWENRGTSIYSIVISRHPVDVLRMSDFDMIQSCHSQGSDYFHCAISEAKGHGPIAYLVKTNDLKNVDLQKDEIFEDDDRGFEGIKPVARIRLRKFSHKKRGNFVIAIPELTVYGASGGVAEKFSKSLREWAIDAQKDIFGNSRPRMDDFVRNGGSYIDNPASKLFNNFFGDDLDKGDAEFDGEQNIADQYQEEIDLINDRYRRVFKNPIQVNASVEQSDGTAYVYVIAEFLVKIPREILLNPITRTSYSLNRDVEIGFKRVIEDICFCATLREVSVINPQSSSIEIAFSLRDEDADGNPDDYRNMIGVLMDLDKEYEYLVSRMLNFLIEKGYVEQYPAQNLLINKDKFSDLQIEEEGEDSVRVGVEILNIGQLPPGMAGVESRDAVKSDNPKIREFGVGMTKFSQRFVKESVPTISINTFSNRVDLYIEFILTNKMHEQDVDEVVNFVNEGREGIKQYASELFKVLLTD